MRLHYHVFFSFGPRLLTGINQRLVTCERTVKNEVIDLKSEVIEIITSGYNYMMEKEFTVPNSAFPCGGFKRVEPRATYERRAEFHLEKSPIGSE